MATLKTVMRRVAPAVWRRRLQEILSVDQVHTLTRIDVPVLCLRATGDRIVPASAGELICRHGRNVRLVDIDAPHLLLQCAADKAVETIDEFMKLFDSERA